MQNKQLSFLIGLWLLACAAHAQDRVITTAVPFLRISTDARASGMGDVGLATTPDANAAFWNMAKLSFAEKRSAIAASYSPWMRDIANDMFLATLNGYYTWDSMQAIHGGLRYFALGDIQFTDALGNHQQAFHPREWAVDLGYSRKLSDRSGLGMTIRYIHSSLSNKGMSGNYYSTGHAISVDLGYYYTAVNNAGNGCSFGGMLSNLGSKMGYMSAAQKDFIPANLGLGMAYTKMLNEQSHIQFGFDINKLLVPTPPANADSMAIVNYRNRTVVNSWLHSLGDAPDGLGEELKEYQLSAGVEYWYCKQLALRAGYAYEDKTKGNRQYFTTGLGIRYNVFTINFSYLISGAKDARQNPLSYTFRLGLIMEAKE